MLRRMRAGRLEQFESTDQVAFEIAARIVDRIAHPGLRCEMDDHVGPMFGKEIGQEAWRFDRLIRRRKAGVLKQFRLASPFQVRIVVIGQ